MPTFFLEEIVGYTAGTVHRSRSGEARGVSTDSRTLGPGELFVALRGERSDGHDYLLTALRRGAWGVLIAEDALGQRGVKSQIEGFPERAVITAKDTLAALGDLALGYRASLPVRVVAVTGSNGKTTTKEMTAAVLGLSRSVHRNRGNFNNLIGLPLTVLELESHHDVAVLEMGMNRRGEIARLSQIARPEVGVVTNVGPAHLEHLGSIEAVAAAKGELIESLGPGGTAVINADDETAGTLRKLGRGTFLTFGLGEEADVRAEDLRCAHDRTVFLMSAPSGRTEVTIPFPGEHNVRNALAAAAAAISLGTGLEEIARGLAEAPPVAMRFTVHSYGGGIRVINDAYNANPLSMKAALDSMNLLEGAARRAAVLGDMLELGAQSVPSHRELGRRAAAAGLDFVIAVGRYAGDVAAGAAAAGMETSRLAAAGDHREAALLLKEWLQPGDLVLLKGSRAIGLEMVLRQLEEDGVLEGEEG